MNCPRVICSKIIRDTAILQCDSSSLRALKGGQGKYDESPVTHWDWQCRAWKIKMDNGIGEWGGISVSIQCVYSQL